MPVLATGRRHISVWRFVAASSRRRPFVVVVIAILAVAAGAALTLSLIASQAQISGHLYHCDGGMGSAAARACRPGEPVQHAIVRFDLAHGSRIYRVTTDSTGAYAVKPGRRVVRDFTSVSWTQ
ncbi:MAG: hypothetical protein E6J32_03660 [Chloroflexi bacterium]|nr:MAG: hypothetical protein E6J32_03660 [Chloroflexota bacterium]